MYRRYGKCALDLALTIPALILLMPLLLLIARVSAPCLDKIIFAPEFDSMQLLHLKDCSLSCKSWNC